MSLYNTVGPTSEGSENTATESTKIAVSITVLSLTLHLQGTLAYISAAVDVRLSSFV